MDPQKIKESEWWNSLVAGFWLAAGGFVFWKITEMIGDDDGEEEETIEEEGWAEEEGFA